MRLLGLWLAACGAGATPARPNAVVHVHPDDAVVAEVDERMLSYAIDTSTLVDVDRDFGRARLRRLASELAPALLRFGGTPADGVYYDVASEAQTCTAPAGFESCVTGARLRAACEFATAVGAELVFTLNAGCGPRDASGAWTPDQARAVVDFMAAEACPVASWELGNEIDLLGLPDDARAACDVSADQFGADYRTAKQMLTDAGSTATLAGPASLWSGGIGLVYFPEAVFEPFLAAATDALDVVTWHWYPEQSCRCQFQSIETTPETMLDPAVLDEVGTWASEVETAVAAHAPQAEVWLGETGHSLCGGQPCVSDRYVSGFWWLDELGQLSRRGQRIVVRQALTEGRYHLVDDGTLEPYPDYWSSILWKRLMGTKVLAPTVDVTAPFDPTRLRTYAHCTRDRPGAVTVVVLNLDPERSAKISFEGVEGAREVYLLTSARDAPASAECRSGDADCVITDEGLQSTAIELGGVRLEVDDSGAPPAMEPAVGSDPIEIPARSYGFVTLVGAGVGGCD